MGDYKTAIFNLRPCPFCGKTPYAEVDEGSFGKCSNGKFSVTCPNEKCSVTGPEGDDMEDAVMNWNRRAYADGAEY